MIWAKATVTVATIVFTFMVYQNCSQPLDSDAVVDIPSSLGKGLDFATINFLILQPKCLRCHNDSLRSGDYSVSNYQNTMQKVTANEPGLSKLYIEVSPGGRMPKGDPRLSDDEVAMIRNWILMGAPESIDDGTGATPVPATFSGLKKGVFDKFCVSCHSGMVPAANYDLTMWSTVRTRVYPTSAETSLLYMKVKNREMPGQGVELPEQMVSALKEWIDKGAAND